MAQTIHWQSPSTTDIIEHEVSRAVTLYGNYTVLITASSYVGSSGAVTSYTDPDGSKTHWYRLRFYDNAGGAWSDYSTPISAEENVRLCTVAEIKRVIDTVGRWADDEIFDQISDTDEFIYYEYGQPLAATWSYINKIDDTIQDTYYLGEENIYRVDRVFYGTTTKTELFLEDGYKVNAKYGMVRILPVGSSGITLDTNDELEAQYVPGLFNKLSIYRTCKALLEKLDFTSGGETSKELQTITDRLNMVEKILSDRVSVQLSSDVKYYDKVYGVNRKHIRQDHDRNAYIGSYGWS